MSLHDSHALPAVDEISKGPLHPLKHVSRFLLCPVKSILDTPFDASERAVLLVRVIRVIIILHIFHRRAGNLPFFSFPVPPIAPIWMVPTGRDDLLKRVTIQVGSPRSSVRKA